MSVLIRTVFLLTDIGLAMFLGSTAKGWPLFILWLCLTSFIVKILIDKSFKERLNNNNYFKKIFLKFIWPDLKYVFLSNSNLYQRILIRRTLFVGTVGGVLSLFNALSDGIWIRQFCMDVLSNPFLFLSIASVLVFHWQQ